MEHGNKDAKSIVKYSMQLAMLRKLLSADLITEAEYEKILGILTSNTFDTQRDYSCRSSVFFKIGNR